MAETAEKKTITKAAVEKWQRGRPKDAQGSESEASYYSRKYMEAHAADTNARVQSEVDEVTRRMIVVEQQLFAAQHRNEDVTSLMTELANSVINDVTSSFLCCAANNCCSTTIIRRVTSSTSDCTLALVSAAWASMYLRE